MKCRVEGDIPSSLTFLLAAPPRPATGTVHGGFAQEGQGDRWSRSCRFDSSQPQPPPRTLAGCTVTISQGGHKQRTAQTIGRSVDQVASRGCCDEAEDNINCTVNTRDGASYRCYPYWATGFQRAMCLGQTPHSDASCTAMAGGKSGSGIQGHAHTDRCEQSSDCDRNAVLRAARRR